MTFKEWHDKQAGCCDSCKNQCPHYQWEEFAFASGYEEGVATGVASKQAEIDKLRENMAKCAEGLKELEQYILDSSGLSLELEMQPRHNVLVKLFDMAHTAGLWMTPVAETGMQTVDVLDETKE